MPNFVPIIDEPYVVPINAYQGDTFSRTFQLFTNTNGTIEAINCVGYDIVATVKKVRGATAPTILQSNSDAGDITLTGSGSNVITWLIDRADTANTQAGALVYDLQLFNATATMTYYTGSFVVTAEVSP